MKSLLIVGAGGHGQVVREIAEEIGYEKTAFLDDHHPEAIGTLAEAGQFLSYGEAFCAIGNNVLRQEILARLEHLGFTIPVLIHPTAYVSRSAVIGRGTVVEPGAKINTGAVVKEGCIISLGAIVDHNTVIENNVHVNAGAIVKAGAHVEACRKLEAGEVVLGYAQAVVRK